LLRHERLMVASGIALLVALSWWYLASGAGIPDMRSMTAMPPPFGAVVLMWWLMMAAMMLPSAAPAVLLYARVRASRGGDAAIAPTSVFLAGYLAVWFLFSLLAATAQRLLTGPAMALDNAPAEAAVLIAAGIYQLSPFKSACLRECRTPAQFISRHWRPGTTGALQLGMRHGAVCVGCCWMLMAVLFVGGIMNLWWIAALTLLVGIEKLAPRGEWIARVVGVGLVGWGIVTVVTPALSRGLPLP
jgi:predicted metal-binding membrane protein